MSFTEWYNEDDHDTHNFPQEAMEAAWNAAIEAAIGKLKDCELVDHYIKIIRLNDAIGSLEDLKSYSGV